jgi:16S rRNA A1518/A1519 N6-dimethyltransferase RsmA/KsgA/DIM1 with predicted DNA glycosylase/AP lyase activity
MQQNDLPISTAAIIIRQDGTRCLGSDESSGWIWQAGRVLASQLLSIIDVRKLRILELGSGTGWLALTLAQEGAIVTATERPGALPLLTRNVYGHLAIHQSITR